MQENHLYRSFTSHRIFKTKAQSQPLSRSLARRFFLVMGLCFGFLMSSSPANASAIAKNTPSFDCGKAETEVEKLICADSDLSQLDAELNEWYRKAIRWQILLAGVSASSQKIQQKEWLERRNKFECRPKVKTPKACLLSLYREAIQVWKNRLLRNEIGRACRWLTETGKECNFKYIDHLLQQSADLNGYDTFYGHCGINGPVYFVAMWASSKQLFDYVIQRGANLKLPIRDDCIATQAFDGVGAFQYFDDIMLMNPKTDLNKWKYWRQNLHPALWVKKPEHYEMFVRKLVSYGADINITSEEGNNLLILIMNPDINEKEFPFNYERTLKMLKYLIAEGIDVAHKNKEGHNALYYLKHSPYKIDKNYYTQFEQLLTPGEERQNL